jgi:hypothetical protein
VTWLFIYPRDVTCGTIVPLLRHDRAAKMAVGGTFMPECTLFSMS